MMTWAMMSALSLFLRICRRRLRSTCNKLIEAVAETDEELMMKYLDGEELTKEEIKAALRKATISNEIVPVVCGSSYKNRGVQKLLDAIVDYMPALPTLQAIKGTVNRRGGGSYLL